MGITQLGSHEWALSNAMNVLWFGAFIKNRILVESNGCWISQVKIISDRIGDYIIWPGTTNGLGLGLGFIDPNSIIQQYPPWHSHSKSIHHGSMQSSLGPPEGKKWQQGEKRKRILKQEAWTIYYLRVSSMNMRVGVTYQHKWVTWWC